MLGSGVLHTIILAHVVGVEGRGEIVVITILPAFFVYLGALGLYDASFYYAAQSDKDPRIVFTTSVFPLLLQGASVVVLLWFLVPLLFANQRHEVVVLTQVFLTIIPVRMVTQLASSILRAKSHLLAVNILSILTTPGLVFGLFVLLASGALTVDTYVALLFALGIMTLLIAIGFLLHYRFLGRAKLDLDLLVKIYNYGTKVFVGSLSLTLSLRLDQLVLASVVPADQLGMYAITSSVASLTGFFAIAVGMVSAPPIARIKDLPERFSETARVFRYYLIASVMMKSAFLVIAPILFPLIYGESLRPAIPILLMLIIASFPYDAQIVLRTFVQSMGYPWITSQSEILGVIVTLVLLLLLLNPLGILGAAIASLVAYSLTFVYLVYNMRSKIALPVRQLFRAT